MVSVKTPQTAFDPTELAELDQIYENVCAAVTGVRDLDDETKLAIRRRLFVLPCNGMKDPVELRDQLISNYALSQPRLGDAADFRERAKICAKLAERCKSASERRRYYGVAKTWISLAARLEKQMAKPDQGGERRNLAPKQG